MGLPANAQHHTPGAKFSSTTACHASCAVSAETSNWLTTMPKSTEIGVELVPTSNTGRLNTIGCCTLSPSDTLVTRRTSSGWVVLAVASRRSVGTRVSFVTRRTLQPGAVASQERAVLNDWLAGGMQGPDISVTE